ncbi:MAG TPA: gephyrin-like molybdotransferase Glp [Aestuariivirgaceae bacterium]|jgi:molybdopterin molybdotransferase
MKKARILLDDCFLHDSERLGHDEAIDLILERVRRIATSEIVKLEDVPGRVIAEDLIAPKDVPSFANAAVDGYAFAHTSLRGGDTRLKVVARIAAGQEARTAIKRGEAVRIFTGAAIPEGADTCIMQEDVALEGDCIVVRQGLKRGANLRKAGEDLKSGEVVVRAGETLRPQEVAAIASIGRDRVACFERLKVALISTGNELSRPGESLGRSGVFDANYFMLRGLVATAGGRVEDYGIVADERNAVERVIERATANSDVILSTGGVSRGEADHIVRAIMERGVLHGWQIAVKPGRPLAIGQIGDKVFLGLPGNPVAVYVTFVLYALPVFAQLQGRIWRPPQRYPIEAGFAFAGKKAGRREFWRGWVEHTKGGVRVKKFPRDGSGLISGLRQATGLIEIPEHVTDVAEGDMVAFIPFAEFGVSR